MKNQSVPFLDLITPHRQLREEVQAAIASILDQASFIGGDVVEAFEIAFAGYCGTRHCVGVNSGTDALHLALAAVGVMPGDVVITVPNTFIATTEAIIHVGAVPEFVDVNERTYNMDPLGLRKYLEANCRQSNGRLTSLRNNRPVTAIVPVHLYGQPADMDPILALAEQYGLKVVEDACQGHGAGQVLAQDGKHGACRSLQFLSWQKPGRLW